MHFLPKWIPVRRRKCGIYKDLKCFRFKETETRFTGGDSLSQLCHTRVEFDAIALHSILGTSMRQALQLKSCAQDCRALAGRERDQRFKSMLLALAAQIDDLANAREAFLKRWPRPRVPEARRFQ